MDSRMNWNPIGQPFYQNIPPSTNIGQPRVEGGGRGRGRTLLTPGVQHPNYTVRMTSPIAPAHSRQEDNFKQPCGREPEQELVVVGGNGIDFTRTVQETPVIAEAAPQENLNSFVQNLLDSFGLDEPKEDMPAPPSSSSRSAQSDCVEEEPVMDFPSKIAQFQNSFEDIEHRALAIAVPMTGTAASTRSKGAGLKTIRDLGEEGGHRNKLLPYPEAGSSTRQDFSEDNKKVIRLAGVHIASFNDRKGNGSIERDELKSRSLNASSSSRRESPPNRKRRASPMHSEHRRVIRINDGSRRSRERSQERPVQRHNRQEETRRIVRRVSRSRSRSPSKSRKSFRGRRSSRTRSRSRSPYHRNDRFPSRNSPVYTGRRWGLSRDSSPQYVRRVVERSSHSRNMDRRNSRSPSFSRTPTRSRSRSRSRSRCRSRSRSRSVERAERIKRLEKSLIEGWDHSQHSTSKSRIVAISQESQTQLFTKHFVEANAAASQAGCVAQSLPPLQPVQPTFHLLQNATGQILSYVSQTQVPMALPQQVHQQQLPQSVGALSFQPPQVQPLALPDVNPTSTSALLPSAPTATSTSSDSRVSPPDSTKPAELQPQPPTKGKRFLKSLEGYLQMVHSIKTLQSSQVDLERKQKSVSLSGGERETLTAKYNENARLLKQMFISVEGLEKSMLRSTTAEELVKLKSNHSKFLYQYVDSEQHWCSLCDVVFGKVVDYIAHLHSSEHAARLQSTGVPSTPWHKKPLHEEVAPGEDANKEAKETHRVPFEGVGCIMPVQAFFCEVCLIFMGDAHCVQIHLRSTEHNDNFLKRCSERPDWAMAQAVDRGNALRRSMVRKQQKVAEEQKKKKDAQHVEEKRLQTSGCKRIDEERKQMAGMKESPTQVREKKNASAVAMEDTSGGVATTSVATSGIHHNTRTQLPCTSNKNDDDIAAPATQQHHPLETHKESGDVDQQTKIDAVGQFADIQKEKTDTTEIVEQKSIAERMDMEEVHLKAARKDSSPTPDSSLTKDEESVPTIPCSKEDGKVLVAPEESVILSSEERPGFIMDKQPEKTGSSLEQEALVLEVGVEIPTSKPPAMEVVRASTKAGFSGSGEYVQGNSIIDSHQALASDVHAATRPESACDTDGAVVDQVGVGNLESPNQPDVMEELTQDNGTPRLAPGFSNIRHPEMSPLPSPRRELPMVCAITDKEQSHLKLQVKQATQDEDDDDCCVIIGIKTKEMKTEVIDLVLDDEESEVKEKKDAEIETDTESKHLDVTLKPQTTSEENVGLPLLEAIGCRSTPMEQECNPAEVSAQPADFMDGDFIVLSETGDDSSLDTTAPEHTPTAHVSDQLESVENEVASVELK